MVLLVVVGGVLVAGGAAAEHRACKHGVKEGLIMKGKEREIGWFCKINLVPYSTCFIEDFSNFNLAEN